MRNVVKVTSIFWSLASSSLYERQPGHCFCRGPNQAGVGMSTEGRSDKATGCRHSSQQPVVNIPQRMAKVGSTPTPGSTIQLWSLLFIRGAWIAWIVLQQTAAERDREH